MKLCARHTDVIVSDAVVLMNRDDSLKLGVGPSDRVRITGEQAVVCSVTLSDTVVPKGTVALPVNVLTKIRVADGDEVEVQYSPMPESVRSIRKKINGSVLSREEIRSIIFDIIDGSLSDTEIIAFVSAFNINNAVLDEISFLAEAMADTGKKIHLGYGKVFDFHSLGGISGNKITPIVVSIIASEGLIIPKMSSRAVSSACGTADFVSTFCDVEMDSDRLVNAIDRTNGVFVCGNQDYAPVGMRIIRVEKPMGIDPLPTMMASIMSKKLAIGTTDLVLDIPVGKYAKISDLSEAEGYAEGFARLGGKIGIDVRCVITRADEPIGLSVGPILEAKECISILENGDGDPFIIDKACSVAGAILEMSGVENGKTQALDSLRSGRAHETFLKIVQVQNGSPDLKASDLIPGRYSKDVHAKRGGYVQYIDNHGIIAIAKAAGAPGDAGAGVLFLHKTGDKVSEGDVLFRIYAESSSKLERAVESARSRRPMYVDDSPRSPCSVGSVIKTM